MSRNARIEEVSDSDLDSDPSDMDPSDFDPTSIIRPANISPPSRNASTATPPVQPQFRAPPPSQANIDVYRKWQCLYPVYFDKSRSRAEGRRVGKELTVNSPLANEIAKAVVSLGLKAVLDVMKRHPKDWSNPGRVKVMLKDSGGGIAGVKNKHHLYLLVAKYLMEHPTTPDTPFNTGLRIQGMPIPDKPLPPPAKPRGWKMNDILPLHSPAVSGGGVSDNIIKDLMQEMGGGMPGMQGGGMPGMPPGMLEGFAGGSGRGGDKEGTKKKEKKKLKA